MGPSDCPSALLLVCLSVSRYYTSGGYAQEFPGANCSLANKTVPCITLAEAVLGDLESTGWIDYRTRVVLVEVFLYNPPLNRFVMVQAILELPSSGAVIPSYSVRTAKLIR